MSNETDGKIVHRKLDPRADNPAIQIAEVVADIEGTDPSALPPMYECVDGMLDNLFSNPPAPEAQMTVTFSYKTYRITIEQDGSAKLVLTG